MGVVLLRPVPSIVWGRCVTTGFLKACGLEYVEFVGVTPGEKLDSTQFLPVLFKVNFMMDRKGKFAVALAIITLIAWQVFYSRQMEKSRLAQEQIALAAPAIPEGTPSVGGTHDAVPAPQPAAQVPVAPTLPGELKRVEILHGADVDWQFSSHGGGVDRVTLLKHQGEGDRPIVLNEFGNVPVGALTESFENPVLDSYAVELVPDGKSIVFRRTDARQLEVVKQFTLKEAPSAGAGKAANPYVLNFEVRFANRSNVPLTVPNYAVRLGSGAPLHAKDLPIYTGFNRFNAEVAKFTDVNWFAGGGFLGFGKKERPEYKDLGAITWAGVTNQYYATILTPLGATASEALARPLPISATEWAASGRAESHGPQLLGIEGAVRMPVVTLEPGKDLVYKFAIFAGPREHGLLRSLGGEQEQMLDFGMFSIVSRTLLKSMNVLKGLLGSYAAAIIVLTLIIKSALWPLQNKSTASMKRMQELQPKMNELKQKYGDDPQKMNQELIALYKKHGVNPMSGCLPMLVQIPIFCGFYNMLGKAVELRNSSFLWVKDLSQPDTVAIISGYPLNVLPLIMAVTMLWQMRLSPKTGDPVQQRMFMFMPLIFIVFCYNFASALALYWAVQNVFSIVQLTITNRQQKTGAQSTVIAPKSGR